MRPQEQRLASRFLPSQIAVALALSLTFGCTDDDGPHLPDGAHQLIYDAATGRLSIEATDADL